VSIPTLPQQFSNFFIFSPVNKVSVFVGRSLAKSKIIETLVWYFDPFDHFSFSITSNVGVSDK